MGKKVKEKGRAKLRASRREAKQKNEANIVFRCLGCGLEELIPREAVEQLDFMDIGDLNVPPRFNCPECPEQMEPPFLY